MKLIVGPRRIGKTTILLKEWVKDPTGILVVPHKKQYEFVFIPLAKRLNIEIPSIRSKRVISFIDLMGRDYMEKDTKYYIDNAEFFIAEFIPSYKNIAVLSITGPTYNWPKRLVNKVLKYLPSIKKRLSKEEVFSQFTLKWK